MSDMLACPECRNDDGNALMGHEERGVYDGVLWWECLMCGLAWPRFTDFPDRRGEAAREAVAEHNRRRAAS